MAVTPGSAAENAGLQQGDVIVTVADHPVANADDLGAAIASLKPGDRIDIAIIRGGNRQSVSLTVGERPAATG